MSKAGWLDRLPGADAALQEFPPYDVEDGLDLHDVRIVGASGSCAELLERPEVVNVALDECDLSGLVAKDGRVSRVLMTGSRLRGVTWAGGMLEDLVLDGVRAESLSLRFSTLRRIVLRDCELPGLDLTETTLDDVRLERCVLVGAEFHAASVRKLRIEQCDLTGCTGADALRGASVHPDDLLTLAPSLADALGVVLDP